MIAPHVQLNVPKIRAELGLTQRELAIYLGVSIRAIQSSEQGWRSLSSAVERLLLLLFLTKRRGEGMQQLECWEYKKCADGRCKDCISYTSRQGYMCWMLTGTRCDEHIMQNYHEKLAHCTLCDFFQQLFPADIFISQ